ncbi:MAG: trypsin-like peptidase domain-containing protein [Planctomycetota bacterium]|nr:trypsin-like peptidase domain-containing protein [Planctomycetota bacterium]
MAFAIVTILGAVTAQGRVDPDEFLHLEPVLQAAMAKAAPFVVTVETFGGTRAVLGTDGPVDGDAPPMPRPPKVQPKPDEAPKPDAPKPEEPKPDDPAPGEHPKPVPMPPTPPGAPDENKDADKKKKLPLTAPGFQQTQGKTSGVVLTADGWILVSRFALNLDPTTILITVPGRGTFHAERAGEDTSRGIALVKIAATDLPVPEFVDPDKVRVGQWSFALGRTFATDEPTVHIGIVSARRRQFGRALQIDAYTSPANYGGAVVDVHGRVLGVAVPLSPSGRNAGVEWYDSGIGFATTIADIPHLLARMKKGEVMQRGWLGVQFETSFLGPGAKISGTPKDGVAAKAGMRKGDILVRVDGVPVMNGPHFQMLVSSRMGGDPVRLEVRKKDETGTVEIGPLVLADAPWSEQQQKKGDELPASFSLPEKNEGR